MIHDQILHHLGMAGGAVQTPDLAIALGLRPTPEDHAVVEIFASLSREVRRLDGGWTGSTDTPARRLMSALRSYAQSNPSKPIFRLSAAIGHLPPPEQPTEERLREMLAHSSEFQLLPNAMIKRVS